MSGGVRNTGVDVRGLLSVLGAHLYSTPIVAVRELVQNAHDSITRRRIEQPGVAGPARIEVSADAELGLLRITDTGSGLTEDEIESFLATIGTGYTRALRADVSAEDEAALIGQFGLGFVSAFVIAHTVTVDTCSYREPERAWRYRSTTGEQYTIVPGPAGMAVGTVVQLELKDEHRALADRDMLRSVLARYCCLLDVPVWIDGDTEPVNEQPPPWRDPEAAGREPAARRARELAFASRFEPIFEPLCTFPVAPHPLAANDREVSDAHGLLWVQDGGTYGSSDNRHVAVFVRGMLLDDDARDLLPYWAGFIGGVIESHHLVPTASREDLQRDAGYRAVQEALVEAIVSGLATVAHQQPEVWRRIVVRHEDALRGTALCDDRLFDLLADAVPIPTSQGDLTVPEMLRHRRGRLHVALGSRGGFEEMLFRSLQVPVARGDRYAVLSFLRRYVESRGGTLVEIGTEAGDGALFQPAELSLDAEHWLSTHLCDPGEVLVPSSFDPPELPFVLVPDREAELKARLEADEADKRMATAALALARRFTDEVDGSVRARLYLNLACPAVAAVVAAVDDGTRPAAEVERAGRLLRSLKVLLMSGVADRDAGPTAATTGRSNVLDALAELAATIDLLLEPPAGG